jgi:transketolase
MTTETVTELTNLDAVAELAAQLRVDSIRSSTSAGSGHPTSSMSAADLIAVRRGDRGPGRRLLFGQTD